MVNNSTPAQSSGKVELPLKPSVETLQQQIDSMKEAVKLLQNFTDRTPTTSDIQWQVNGLKELTQIRFELEKERNDDLNNQRNEYEKRIADILAEQKNKDALLLSTQVDKLGVTTGERLSIIEKNQYSAGGSAAVRDPQLADAMAAMAASIKQITGTKSEGLSAAWGYIMGIAAMLSLAILGASFIIARL